MISDNCTEVEKICLECVFPQLRESEDEEIRKDVLAFIRREGQHIDKYKWHKWIAWLEKQQKQSFTHHEINESLQDAVTHQMEDDSDVNDFVRRGIDNIALKYAKLGAEWMREQINNTLKAKEIKI